jgi:hypothetical protein
MKVKKEYYKLKAKRREFDKYHRIPNIPDFSSHNEACQFYRDNCNKSYYMMDMYEKIAVHKCFDIEDEFFHHLNPPEAIAAGSVTVKKTESKPRAL